MKASCGRADLIRLHAALGAERSARCAAQLGFRPREGAHAVRIRQGDPAGKAANTLPNAHATTTEPPSRLRAPVPFFRMDSVEQRQPSAPDTAEPPPLTEAEIVGRARYAAPPRRAPLAPCSQLWPRLHRQLTTPVPGQLVDMERLSAVLCRGEVPQELPRLQTLHWPTRLTVLIDRSERLTPFFADQDDVCRVLRTRLGRRAVLELILPGGPQCEALFPDNPANGTPIAGEPVLALTDLGGYGSAADRRSWLQLAHTLRRAGHPRLALCPAPARRCPATLDRAWRRMAWEREGVPQERDPALAECILQLLSFAVRVEPGLLRAVRRLPALRGDVETEAAAWHDRRVDGTHPVALSFVPRQLPALHAGLSALAHEQPAWVERVVDLVRAWHRDVLPAEIWYEELLNLSLLAPELNATTETTASRRFAKRLAPSLDHPGHSSTLRDYVALWFRRLQRRLPEKAWTDAHVGAGLVRAFCRVHSDARTQRLPPGVDPALLSAKGAPVRYELRQIGCTLRIAPAEPTGPGSPVGDFMAVAPWARLLTRVDDTPLDLDLRTPCVIESAPEAFSLLSDRTSLAVSVCHRPPWACGVGRDRAGLWVERDLGGLQLRKRWRPGRRSAAASQEQGCWVDEGFSQLPPWPRWVVDCGRDPLGIWIAFELGGVRQRMRWIEASAFQAAQGEYEAGPGPELSLGVNAFTPGYYLAETPCTQALWRAVTGEIPQRSGGEGRPVEQVSWNDCQRFVSTLNARLPGLDARLPSVAEWEYARSPGARTQLWEWCADRWDSAAPAPQDGSSKPHSNRRCVVRASAWIDESGVAHATQRAWFEPDLPGAGTGFRLARAAAEMRTPPC